MKKFLTQKINISYALIVIMVLVIGVSQATAQYAQPGNVADLVPLVHTGAGEQVISGSPLYDQDTCPHQSLSPSAPNYSSSPYYLECVFKRGLIINGDNGLAVGLDARGSASSVSQFLSTNAGSVFAALQNSFFTGRLFIGQGSSPTLNMWQLNYGSSVNPLTVPIQKVNVHGNVLATNLQNATGDSPVCVTNAGVIVLCPDVDYFQYECSNVGTGQWTQPSYSQPNGTIVDGGQVQDGVLVYNQCPANSIPATNAYDTSASYSVGDRVCGETPPNAANCTLPVVPAFSCGLNTPGEWSPASYSTPSCGYTNYTSGNSYNQGDYVCASSGSPSNSDCTLPPVPAYVCGSVGTWSPASYSGSNCPYSSYNSAATYNNGDLVCSATGTPSIANCRAAINGSCGSADGQGRSTPPTAGLCQTGNSSIVASSGGNYTWNCTGSNGGTTDSCSAPIVAPAVNGACGSANGTLYLEEPQPNTRCASGTPTGTSSYAPWTWSCNGSNGGINVSCSTRPNNWRLVTYQNIVPSALVSSYPSANTAYAGDVCPDVSPSGMGQIYFRENPFDNDSNTLLRCE